MTDKYRKVDYISSTILQNIIFQQSNAFLNYWKIGGSNSDDSDAFFLRRVLCLAVETLTSFDSAN